MKATAPEAVWILGPYYRDYSSEAIVAGIFVRFGKLGRIHNDQSDDDFYDVKEDYPQNAQNE